MSKIEMSILEEHLGKGLIQRNSHNRLPLYIWNYTPKTQYERLWNEITLNCRALVTDYKGEIIARSFKKFFNIEEEKELPNEKFVVYEKLDGSLITVFWYNEEVVVSSRGSFDSVYSKEAEDILKSYEFRLEKDRCYSFELIAPWNRIVCDYGSQRKLVLLAKFDREGNDYEIEKYSGSFPIARKLSMSSLENLKEKIPSNEEGYVIRFENGKRVKIKGEEYVALHRLVSAVSENMLIDLVCSGDRAKTEDILSKLPDELYGWAKEFRLKLENKFQSIQQECISSFKEFPSRKETAAYFSKQKYPGLLFCMLDKKNFEVMIWKVVRSEIKNELQEDSRNQLRSCRKMQTQQKV